MTRGVVAFDCETCLIRPALLAPPLVCVTWKRVGGAATIAHHFDAEPIVRRWLESDDVIVGHNVAFDMAVVAERYPSLRTLIFAAYAADRVTDTLIRAQLLDIAAGTFRGRLVAAGVWVPHSYDLQSLAKREAGMQLFKDGWRLSYSSFLDTPLSDWPRRAKEVQEAARPRVAQLDGIIAATGDKEAIKERAGLLEMIAGDPTRASEYPLDDARATLAVYQAQEKHVAYLQDQYRQTRAAFALHLSSAWGLRTDAVGVESLRAATQGAYDALEEELIQIGLVRNDKARTRDTKAAKARMIRVCLEERATLRRTDSHGPESTRCKDASGNPLPGGDDACAEHVCLDGDACQAVEDDVIRNYQKLSELKKVLTNDVELLKKGVTYPVSPRYGLAETCRSTCSKPNIQSLRRLPGVREAFVPRKGNVFFSADYPQLELYCLAQCCVSWFGKSKLADTLNAGLDPHLGFASVVLSIPYESAKARYDAGDVEVADVRHLCKQANFGFPGGLGIPKFEKLVRKNLKPEIVQRLGIDVARLKLLKAQWFEALPEMPHYFARVNALCDTDSGKGTAETLFTKRFRGGASYCALCNNGFQALGADCAKESAWRIAREQYDTPSSPLFNTRTVAFVHDEFVCESTEGTAHEAAQRLADVMAEGANVYLPNVQIKRAKIKPLLMRRWSKNAVPVLGADGRLVPWGVSTP